MVTKPWCWASTSALHKLTLSCVPTKASWQDPLSSRDRPVPDPHLCLQGFPGREKICKELGNVQREKMHVHSNCPAIGISAFWSGCLVLGAWLGHLWSTGHTHPAHLASLIFSDRAFKAQKLSLHWYCSY